MESVAKELKELGHNINVRVRFMPFQLYPQLPAGTSNEGMVKDELFKGLIDQRAPGMTEEQRRHRADGLVEAWNAEGLCLKSPPTGLNTGGGGRMGSSFDSQRLILLAREQGVEDAMIEEVYAANHTRDECLSDWKVLLRCAERAGVKKAEVALLSGWGMRETVAKIEEYKAMGVTAVPVIVIDSYKNIPIKAVLSSGAPEREFLRQAFLQLIETGKLPWQPAQHQLPSPQPKANWNPNRDGPAKLTQPSKAAPKATPAPKAEPLAAGGSGGGARARVLQMLGGGAAPSGEGAEANVPLPPLAEFGGWGETAKRGATGEV